MLVGNSDSGAGVQTQALDTKGTQQKLNQSKDTSSSANAESGNDATAETQEETNPIKNAVGSVLEGIDDAKDFINDQRYNFSLWNPLGPVTRVIDSVFPTGSAVISNGVDKALDFVRDKLDIEDPDDVEEKTKADARSARSARGMEFGHADTPLLDDFWDKAHEAVDNFETQVKAQKAQSELQKS